MRAKGIRRAFLAGVSSCGIFAQAQTHALKKTDTVVRAVAVYEWTGEEGKPTASRLMPVSLFINGQLRDAAVYLARPVPFALETGTVYEAEKAGGPEGTLELAYQRHLTSSDAVEIDDGWLGYAAFKPKPAETVVAKKGSGPLAKVEVSGGKARAGSSGANAGAAEGKTDDAADAGRKDPDRPSFHKRADASSPDTSGSGKDSTASDKASDGSSPDDPAERPTLKRRTPSEIKADAKKKDSAKVIAGNDLNDDPDRPNLHRGKPVTRMEEEDLPPLRGLPKDMQQMAAVSDATERSEHEFRRRWESDPERAEALGKMQAFAREQLAAYKVSGAVGTSANSAGKSQMAGSKARRGSAGGTSATPIAALTDEELNGYVLSYGGAPTYVYQASSPGAGGVTRYVTVVAQEVAPVGLKVALANVTDSGHLDRMPQMRLVDAVDAEASNRASLLMELRAQHTRQFALYRVIGAQADQIFLTGTTGE